VSAALRSRRRRWYAALTSEPADVCGRERGQSLHFRWPDVSAERTDDCLDQCLSCLLMSFFATPVVLGSGNEVIPGIGHGTRVAQLACATEARIDTLLRN
jgi:hypothetical protein